MLQTKFPSDAIADSVAAAAARLGISRSAAYNEIGAGRLAAKKMGRRTLVLREEQDRWARSLPEMAA